MTLRSRQPRPKPSAASPNDQTKGAHGIRKPVQDRSRAVVSRILQATHDLLNEAPLDQLTMYRVAERADISVASIYRYYADKMDLLRAVQDRCLSDLVEKVAAAVADAEPTVESAVSAMVSANDEMIAARAAEFAAFLLEGRPDAAMVRRSLEQKRAQFDILYAGLQRDRARVAHENLELATAITLEIVLGLFLTYARSHASFLRELGVTGPPRADVVQQSRRAAVSYLLRADDGDEAARPPLRTRSSARR